LIVGGGSQETPLEKVLGKGNGECGGVSTKIMAFFKNEKR
jgi:hypothetical protein